MKQISPILEIWRIVEGFMSRWSDVDLVVVDGLFVLIANARMVARRLEGSIFHLSAKKDVHPAA